MRNRYDWKDLKAKYMTAEAVSVQEFLDQCRSSGKPVPKSRNASVQIHTKGWRLEKDQMKDEIIEAVKGEIKQAEIEEMAEALKAARVIIRKITRAYLEMAMRGDALSFPMSQFKQLWKMTRTECGLPTTILKESPPQPSEEDEQEILDRLYKYDDEIKKAEPIQIF